MGPAPLYVIGGIAVGSLIAAGYVYFDQIYKWGNNVFYGTKDQNGYVGNYDSGKIFSMNPENGDVVES